MDALDRIESGPWVLYAPSLVPLLVKVARAAEPMPGMLTAWAEAEYNGDPTGFIDEDGQQVYGPLVEALDAVRAFADEHFPEAK